MGDRLTELQDAVDQFATQMVASIHYINRHHDLELLGPKDQINSATKQNPEEDQKELDPHPADSFQESQLELARDLIMKEQQIELLVSRLTGLTSSEKDQERQIKDLEEELKEAEAQRKEAIKEKEATMKKLDAVIRSIRRP